MPEPCGDLLCPRGLHHGAPQLYTSRPSPGFSPCFSLHPRTSQVPMPSPPQTWHQQHRPHCYSMGTAPATAVRWSPLLAPSPENPIETRHFEPGQTDQPAALRAKARVFLPPTYPHRSPCSLCSSRIGQAAPAPHWLHCTPGPLHSSAMGLLSPLQVIPTLSIQIFLSLVLKEAMS